jgi:septin family protein
LSLVVEEVSNSLIPTSLPVLLLTVELGIGKTSFLRLLLDTSVVSSRTTKDQLASVAKFVQGSSGHTAHLRTASIDINNDLDGNGQYQSLGLSLIDTPSLDFKDEVTAERFLSETIRHIDGRFAEGIEDVGAHTLCLLTFLILLFRTGKHRQAIVTSICE